MLESKKFIYNTYKDDIEFLCEKYTVDTGVAIDMMVADLAKLYELHQHIFWYECPTFDTHMFAYEFYLDLVEEERN